jgi:hypothetical protein
MKEFCRQTEVGLTGRRTTRYKDRCARRDGGGSRPGPMRMGRGGSNWDNRGVEDVLDGGSSVGGRMAASVWVCMTTARGG